MGSLGEFLLRNAGTCTLHSSSHRHYWCSPTLGNALLDYPRQYAAASLAAIIYIESYISRARWWQMAEFARLFTRLCINISFNNLLLTNCRHACIHVTYIYAFTRVVSIRHQKKPLSSSDTLGVFSLSFLLFEHVGRTSRPYDTPQSQ